MASVIAVKGRASSSGRQRIKTTPPQGPRWNPNKMEQSNTDPKPSLGGYLPWLVWISLGLSYVSIANRASQCPIGPRDRARGGALISSTCAEPPTEKPLKKPLPQL